MKAEKRFVWIAFVDDKPCNSFPTRKEAVKWLKDILKQESCDYEKQDRTNEYDYNILIRKLEIRKVEKREAYLGL
jgi:hypothetical protein